MSHLCVLLQTSGVESVRVVVAIVTKNPDVVARAFSNGTMLSSLLRPATGLTVSPDTIKVRPPAQVNLLESPPLSRAGSILCTHPPSPATSLRVQLHGHTQPLPPSPLLFPQAKVDQTGGTASSGSSGSSSGSSSSSGGSSAPIGAIVGGVIGGLVGLALIVWLVIYVSMGGRLAGSGGKSRKW